MKIFSDLEAEINASKLSKSAISRHLGITRGGFDKMITNHTLSLIKFTELCKILSIDPCRIFECTGESVTFSTLNDPATEYRRKQIDTTFDIVEINGDKDLINYQAKQIDRLTRIIETLTDKLDTRINPS